ncbi:MAG: hypothetical protein QGI20_04340 [Verrucomicrobiota bacterium]|nr:hypothetical protein [Verrucomicrobiota bacterium]|tara:strand:- start:297 stop:947 length:651 start_codon:yes stop_codon:yes gene_type:complete
MNSLSKFAGRYLLALGLAALTAHATEPLYQTNFEKTELGEVPDDFLVLDGDFSVRQESGNRFLELPGAPLDAFGFMFGPSARHGNEITARMFGTKKGRRYPVFGIALNGVNGYRLQVAPAKRAIELLKAGAVVAKAPFRWGGEWLRFSLRVEKTSEAEWIISGKVWPDGKKPPAKPTVTHKEAKEPRNGKPSIWGSPYSGTPIRYDDIVVKKIAKR